MTGTDQDATAAAAFVDAGFMLAPTGQGPLQGMRFAVKDVIEVAGRVAAAGSPAFAATREPARASAPVIARLLAAGARLEGMTVTDELMFGVLGQTANGVPPGNPRAPDRLPGGSSSGSASVVAAGLRDFALGTDTGGSVRVPASFCGICGLRPGWGQIAMDGVIPLAPRFDTLGWFARDLATMEAVRCVLLPDQQSGADWPTALWLPPEAIEGLPVDLAAAVSGAAERIAQTLHLPICRETLGSGSDEWAGAYKILQGIDTWATYGEWIRSARPSLGPVAARRFAAASAIDPETAPAAEAMARRLAVDVLPALKHGRRVLLASTTPCPAPMRDASDDALEAARAAVLARTALAGMLGLAELSLPWLSSEGAPVGLSMLALPGREASLIALAARVESSMADAG